MLRLLLETARPDQSGQQWPDFCEVALRVFDDDVADDAGVHGVAELLVRRRVRLTAEVESLREALLTRPVRQAGVPSAPNRFSLRSVTENGPVYLGASMS